MMIKDIIKKFIPLFLLDLYHLSLAFGGALFYGFPSRKLKVVGVTGTNGKSTVVLMADRVLSEAGFKTASLSSISFKIGEKEWPNTLKMTMPGRFQIQKFLRQAVNEGCKFAVLEVTSEGIKQHRHRFINFDAAVFTNLSKEHIERHGGFEKYREAKGRLFQACRNVHILNINDQSVGYFLKFPASQKYFYQFKSQNSNLKITIKNSKILEIPAFNLKLLGEFNNYNAASAIAVGLSYGIDLETCKKAVEKIESIPGRMELVIREPFKVIVDYAHTPEALRKVYETIENWKLEIENSRMVCVLGAAGGGRDKWKRPELGKIAAQYCDKIILTNEDPYDEDPNQILSEIKSGISNSKFLIFNFYEILDRREAIRKALSLAKPDDTVIITGKGSEPWMCVAGGKKIPWSDKQIVLDILSMGDSI